MEVEREFGIAAHVPAAAYAKSRFLGVCVLLLLALPYVLGDIGPTLSGFLHMICPRIAIVFGILAYISYAIGKAFAGSKIVIQGNHIGVAGVLSNKIMDAEKVASVSVKKSFLSFARVTIESNTEKLSFSMALADPKGLVAALNDFLGHSTVKLTDAQNTALESAANICLATSPRISRSALLSVATIWTTALVGTVVPALVWEMTAPLVILWLFVSVMIPAIAHAWAELVILLQIFLSKNPEKTASASKIPFYATWGIIWFATYLVGGILFHLHFVKLQG